MAKRQTNNKVHINLLSLLTTCTLPEARRLFSPRWSNHKHRHGLVVLYRNPCKTTDEHSSWSSLVFHLSSEAGKENMLSSHTLFFSKLHSAYTKAMLITAVTVNVWCTHTRLQKAKDISTSQFIRWTRRKNTVFCSHPSLSPHWSVFLWVRLVKLSVRADELLNIGWTIVEMVGLIKHLVKKGAGLFRISLVIGGISRAFCGNGGICPKCLWEWVGLSILSLGISGIVQDFYGNGWHCSILSTMGEIGTTVFRNEWD